MKKILIFLIAFLFVGVASYAVTTGTIKLGWDQVTANSDGSPITDLAGYRIYYGNDQSGPPYNGIGLPEGDSPITIPLIALADVTDPVFTLTQVPSGTYYIVVTAYDDVANESGYSNELTAGVVDTISPSEVVVHTVTVTVP